MFPNFQIVLICVFLTDTRMIQILEPLFVLFLLVLVHIDPNSLIFDHVIDIRINFSFG